METPSRPPHPFEDGRLSYLQLPATDLAVSARFYAGVFGWRCKGDGARHRAFTDATGHMIGAFITGRLPTGAPGILPYVYVHGIDAALARVVAYGGEVVRSPYPEGDLWVGTFRDPAGNVLGVWQHGPR